MKKLFMVLIGLAVLGMAGVFAIEYVIPAKSSETIEFNETVDSLKGEWWGFGWVNSNGSIGNGSCDWWSQQKEIIIDKDGCLTYKDNGSTKKMSQIQKL